MNFPERITIPMSTEMKEELEQLAPMYKDSDGMSLKVSSFCRQIIEIYLKKVGRDKLK